MKYILSFLIVLLLYVMCLPPESEARILSRRQTLKEKRTPAQSNAQRSVQNVAVDDRGRSIVDIGQILDPLLGTPITVQAVILEILKYPIKQTLVSLHWTNEHIIRRIIQYVTTKMNNFYDTYLDSTDLPIIVAIAAFILGTAAESFTTTDEVIDKLDNFINDILDVIVGDD